MVLVCYLCFCLQDSYGTSCDVGPQEGIYLGIVHIRASVSHVFITCFIGVYSDFYFGLSILILGTAVHLSVGVVGVQ